MVAKMNIVGRNVDALYLSVKCDVPEKTHELLWAAKYELQQNSDDQKGELLELEGVPGGMFYIYRHGRGKYQYKIENKAVYIEITKWKNLPSFQIQFKAETLYEYTLTALELITDRIVKHFCGENSEPKIKVNRFDMAVDFQPEDKDWSPPPMDDFITRAQHRTVSYTGSEVNAMTFGERGNSVQVQIYNKSNELLSSGKTWMYEVWRASGNYRPGREVWRAEIRLWRVGLHQMGVDTIRDLREVLGDLVHMVVNPESGSWFRVGRPEDRHMKGQNSNERKAPDWWVDIAEAFKKGLNVSGRKRKTQKPKHSFRKSLEMAGSYMAKTHALARDSGLQVPMTAAAFGKWCGEVYSDLLGGDNLSWPEKVNEKSRQIRLTPAF
jgi:hypothetical protein